jgi:hypothetical protein
MKTCGSYPGLSALGIRLFWFVGLTSLFVSGFFPRHMAAEQRSIPNQSIRIPLTFEQNRGQAGKPIRFIARSGAGRVLLTRDGAIFAGSQEPAHPIRLYFDKGQLLLWAYLQSARPARGSGP